jgi:ADP-ribose pyrophosphatase YjhB (NUDIX family)
VKKHEIRIRVGGVYVKGGKILLVRHEKQGRTYWLLPGGGVEFGESFEAALERELREECGIATKTGRLLFINESIPKDGHRHIVNLTFHGRVLKGKAALSENDSVLREVAWVERAKLPKLLFFPDFMRQIAQHWDAGFKRPFENLGNLWKD